MAKDLGSQKYGGKRYLWQVYTSIALFPLGIWVLYFIISSIGLDYTELTLRLQNPISSSLMLMFIFTALYHFYITVSVIIEDYIHTKWFFHFARILVKFGMLWLGIMSLIFIWRI